MNSFLHFKKLLIIPLLLMMGNVCLGQYTIPNFTPMKQTATGYDNVQLGNCSNATIYSAGCVMTCQSMLLALNGLTIDPLILNTWYTNNNKYVDKCLVRNNSLCSYTGSTIKYIGRTYEISNSTFLRVKKSIDNNDPVIMRVAKSGCEYREGCHSVVVFGYKNQCSNYSDLIIANPSSYAPEKPIYFDFYSNVYKQDPIPNQSLSIYGGTVAIPKEINVYFAAKDFNTNESASSTFSVPYFNIYNSATDKLVTVESNYISQLPSTTVGSTIWRHFKVNLASVSLADKANLPSNGFPCDIGFDVVAGGVTKKFRGAKQLYFLDPNTLTDIGTLDDKWYDKYVKDGIDFGLFRGSSPADIYSSVSFKPSEKLTKSQAAAVAVIAGVKLGILNIDTSGTPFSDVPSTHNYFKFIQTLKNKGFVGGPGVTFFGGSDTEYITQDRFCKWVALACNITAADKNQLQYVNTSVNIKYTSNDTTLQPYVDILTKTPSIRTSATADQYKFIEPLYSPFDYSTVTTSTIPTTYVCDKNVTRDIMAKVMTLVYEYKRPKVTNAQGRLANTTNTIPSDFIAYGEKYDNASITATSTPITPTQQTYSVASGGKITILYNPGSLPQHYYWSMLKNGATLTSNNEQHSSVTFTAPTVATPTQWKIYTYTANNRGKARETFITIIVGGSSGGTNAAPTNQAHSLSLYGATSSSLTASWTRGNGQNCIVTCKEVGANAQDLPDSGVIYSSNSNFNSAPAIFSGSDTKVVYTGNASSVNITGLNPNTQYQVSVFEYNGTTPATVQYNLSNAPLATVSTIKLVNTTPLANFIWDESLTFQTGQAFVFTNTSTNANTYKWSISPSGTISNTTSSSTTNVTFTNSGQHTLTLIATNTATGETSTRTHNFYVNNAAELMADLQPTNLNFTSPIIAGQNLTITCNVQNNSTASASYTTHITFVLSADQIIDSSDHFLGQQEYTIGAGESVSITHNATNIYNTFSGNYYILAKADYWNNVPNGYVPESNETNNTISKAINLVAALPDLVALSLTPSITTVTSGQQFSATGTFRNIGLGNTGSNVLADFYISNDNILSLDDKPIQGTMWVSSSNNNIQYGNSPVVSATTDNIRLPFDIENGNYYIICAIDYSLGGFGIGFDYNLESNENNNSISTPIRVLNPNQPTVNANNFSISNVTSNSIGLSWNRGNGQGCIVLARANSDLPHKIIDDVSYTPNPNFNLAPGIRGYYSSYNYFSVDNYSNVKLVYDGQGDSVNISGLDSNTTYSFIVLEYNGSGTAKDYLQISNFKCISAHTLGQNKLDPFQRKYGTILPDYYSSLYYIRTVKFFDEQNGLIFRNNNGLGLTNDGGKSWSFMKNNLIEKNAESWLKSSSWLENGSGWLVFENGSILKTMDFGKSWTEKILDRSIEDVCFVNQKIGFVALKNLINVSGNDGAIYKTTDGGSTWSSVGAFPRIISSIFFLNENLGWATSYTTSSSFDKIFYKTTNGGNTWDQVIFSTNPSQSSVLTDIYFTDANNGFAMTIFGWLLKTTNGGTSWSMNNIFNISTTINSHSKIDFVNSKIGFINLQNKKLAKTVNGGLSWSITDIQNDYPSNAHGFTAEVDAISENIVYVGGIGGLLKSTTGGSSNSIEINTLSQTTYCSTENINLSYNIAGFYDTNNIFNVELSDAAGAFTTPLNIKSFTSAGTSSVNISLPQNVVAGSGYKLRIVGTSPSIVSNVTNTFAVSQAPKASISITPASSTICPNQSVTFTATPTNGGTSPTYTWKKNGTVVGSNSPTYTDAKLKNDDIIWVEMVSNQACASSVPVASVPSTIQVTQIDELFVQAIDDILASSTDLGVQWLRNGQPIVGATSQFYEATQTGFYRFSTTVGGCTVMSDIYSLTSLGTNTNEFENKSLKVFPNPFSDKLNIQTNEDNLQSVKIIDLQGRLIKQEKVLGSNYELNLETLPKATYILEIISDKAKQSVKVIKK